MEILFLDKAQLEDNKKLSQEEKSEILKRFTPGTQLAYVDPGKDTMVYFDKHAIEIYIPKEAFTYTNGRLVDKKVTLSFKNYKTSADVVFSGIPMTTKDGRMNSSGMFDIHGTENGRKVKIAPNKGLEINYNMTQLVSNTNFYYMDPKSESWVEQRKLTNEKAQLLNPLSGGGMSSTSSGNIKKRKGFWPFNRLRFVFRESLRGGYDGVNSSSGKILASGTSAGHTFPKQVQALQCKNFGVYNCDQIYRLGGAVSLKSSFKTADGKELKNIDVLSLVDYKFQGAISMNPYFVTFNPSHQNTFLLFSSSGKVYGLHKNEFPKVAMTTKTREFIVEDITDKVNNVRYLQAYLDH